MSGSITALDNTAGGTATTSTGVIGLNPGTLRGPVFTAGDGSPTWAITGLRLALNASASASYTITVSLYAANGSTPTGSALASTSFAVSLTSVLSYTLLSGAALGDLAGTALTGGASYALVAVADTFGARLLVSSGSTYATSDGFSFNGLASGVHPYTSWANLAFKPMFELQTQATCFLRGTLILTARGEVKVEALRAGDLVATRFGGLRPIRWIGTQCFEGRLAGKDHQPIRFAAGSLGAGLPSCALWVSPGHAVLVGEVLAHAGALVNGTTITQERVRGMIEYFHLDLGPHDCVLANGAWAESYFEDRNRDSFHNAAEFHALHPGHVPERQATCLPVITAEHPGIGALRRALAPVRRAAA